MRVARAVIACVAASLSAASLHAAGVPLVDAIKKSDAAAVRALIRQGPGAVNASELDGTTPLHWAARLNDLEAADLLIRAGANAKAANRYGVTPLALASINGSAPMIERLLKAGADPNVAAGEGETPLMTAARAGSAASVRLLVAQGAKVNVAEKFRGQTSLMWAAAEGNVDVIKVLLELGADTHARSQRGFTPFLFAVREGHIPAVKALLEAGVNVNETLPRLPPVDGDMSALMLAVNSAHFELANVLLEAGADPNADDLGYTALHLISWVRRPGEGANAPKMVGSGSMDSLTLVRKLAARGANLNARMTKAPRDGSQDFNSFLNWKGATPMITAARSVDAPLMRLLAELGANPLLPNDDGTQPLLVAAGIGVRSPTEDPGTEPEILDAVTVALDRGGDVNAVDMNGETVMHGAAVRGLNSLIRLLVERGAKVEVWNRPNKRGLTPLSMAEGHQKINNVFLSQPQIVPLLKQLIAGRGAL